MARCIELAGLGAGSVAPNPMVGAVLVHNERIIGEGYHMQYGKAHAEVNCINAVRPEDQFLLPESTMYVSLEPCAHFGKTPPCADLIIRKKIPAVVIGCRDPFAAVNGRGIEKLVTAGIEVTQPVLETACKALNKRFFTFHLKQRPYIIAKWAQSANGFIGNADHSRLLISNAFTNRLVHRWRSEEAGILAGTHTALFDNPSLTTRLWKGKNPVRIVMDRQLRLPPDLQLFDGAARTIIFNYLKNEEQGSLSYYRLDKEQNIIHQLCQVLHRQHIQSVLVEGGAALLQSFIDAKIVDEVRIITNTALHAANGIAAPVTGSLLLQHTLQLHSDTVQFYHPAV